MGNTLEFYLIDSEILRELVSDENFEFYFSETVFYDAMADFSLHLTMKDLNLLSRQFGKFSRQKPIDIRPYMDIFIDTPGYGLIGIQKKWVRYAAKVKEKHIDKIIEAWFIAIQNEYQDEEIIATQEAKQAVQDLMLICKAAKKKDKELIHIWLQ